MKFFQTALFLAPLLAAPTSALPSSGPTGETSLVPRQFGAAGRLSSAVERLLDIMELVPSIPGTWDYDSLPDACSVKMYTKGGARCKVTIECRDYKKEYTHWNVCYIGGRQFFHDDAIGEFSVTFTANDPNRQSLGYPVLQVKNIEDWLEWPVDALAKDWEKNKDRSNRPTPLCNNLPEGWKYSGGTWGGEVIYQCGVPRLGKSLGGHHNALPENERGYAPGWCGMHITQHQKPDPSRDNYRFDLQLFDANGKRIGQVFGAEAGETIGLTSQLPYVMLVDGGRIDADPVTFRYAGQHWDSNDGGRCKFGRYDNMKREGDCGFSC